MDRPSNSRRARAQVKAWRPGANLPSRPQPPAPLRRSWEGAARDQPGGGTRHQI